MSNKVLTTYTADKGSCVINGVSFDNGIGDGVYQVIVSDTKPKGISTLAWIDLRDVPTVMIWASDCDASSKQPFSAPDFDNAEAIGIGVADNGNVVIWKMF